MPTLRGGEKRSARVRRLRPRTARRWHAQAKRTDEQADRIGQLEAQLAKRDEEVAGLKADAAKKDELFAGQIAALQAAVFTTSTKTATSTTTTATATTTTVTTVTVATSTAVRQGVAMLQPAGVCLFALRVGPGEGRSRVAV